MEPVAAWYFLPGGALNGLGTGSVGNCPSFSDEQQCLFEPKRQDVPDARSAEIDVVDHVRKFLDQTHSHRVRVVAKSADPMHVGPSCHHPCHIDCHSTINVADRAHVSDEQLRCLRLWATDEILAGE